MKSIIIIVIIIIIIIIIIITMDIDYSPQERAIYELRLKKGLDNINNTSMIDCVEDMATNAQATGTQAANIRRSKIQKLVAYWTVCKYWKIVY